MNYFEYNATQVRNASVDEPGAESLVFSGDEVILVDEDYDVTVDEIRAYIRELHADAGKTPPPGAEHNNRLLLEPPVALRAA